MRLRSRFLIGMALALLTLAAYAPLAKNQFINYDDPVYLTENRLLQGGLSWKNAIWAFQTTRAANWHPLTWISHLVDVSLFGLQPLGHHLMSLGLHLANTVLLFAVLSGMTGAPWRSGLVAGLFGLHPLHVESVAWAAERKDVLAAFFGILTIGAYGLSLRRPGLGKRSLLVLLLGLGLMAKPTLVSLPFVLLLLDYWPLARFRLTSGAPLAQHAHTATSLVLEKLPLFALAAVSGIVTWVAQESGGSVTTLGHLGIGLRLENAVAAYAAYLGKTVLPRGMAVFYPHPMAQLGLAKVLVGACFLGAATFAVLRKAGRRPWRLVGWFWYLGTLIPVIGLVQVGSQAMADRYTYLPLIGVFLLAAWEFGGFVKRIPHGNYVSAAVALLLAATLVLLTRTQVGYWRDGITLFHHAAEVTRGNAMAELHLAAALADQGRLEDAIAHNLRSIALDESNPISMNNQGVYLAEKGNSREAISFYREAIRLRPDYAIAHNNLGESLLKNGQLLEAMREFQLAIRLQADFDKAYDNLGNAYYSQGKTAEAITQYSRALAIAPENAKAHFNLGNSLANAGRADEAIAHYEEAIRLRPRFAEAYNNLGIVMANLQREKEAEESFRHAVEADPANPDFRTNFESLRALRRSRGAVPSR